VPKLSCNRFRVKRPLCFTVSFPYQFATKGMRVFMKYQCCHNRGRQDPTSRIYIHIRWLWADWGDSALNLGAGSRGFKSSRPDHPSLQLVEYARAAALKHLRRRAILFVFLDNTIGIRYLNTRRRLPHYDCCLNSAPFSIGVLAVKATNLKFALIPFSKFLSINKMNDPKPSTIR
jgi:hypothetical protein